MTEADVGRWYELAAVEDFAHLDVDEPQSTNLALSATFFGNIIDDDDKPPLFILTTLVVARLSSS